MIEYLCKLRLDLGLSMQSAMKDASTAANNSNLYLGAAHSPFGNGELSALVAVFQFPELICYTTSSDSDLSRCWGL